MIVLSLAFERSSPVGLGLHVNLMPMRWWQVPRRSTVTIASGSFFGDQYPNFYVYYEAHGNFGSCKSCLRWLRSMRMSDANRISLLEQDHDESTTLWERQEFQFTSGLSGLDCCATHSCFVESSFQLLTSKEVEEKSDREKQSTKKRETQKFFSAATQASE